MQTSKTTSSAARRDIQQQVTDTIIRQLEAGTIPWHRPWKGADNKLPPLPLNCTTGKKYRGINIILLWCTAIEKEYCSPEWASFKQWQQRKEAIRKGEKGSMIVYYDVVEKEIDGEIRKIPFLKSSVVFNRCQLQSYEPLQEAPLDYTQPLAEKIDVVDEFITNSNATIAHIGSSACYVPADDIIYMPDLAKFITTERCTATEGYYSTLLHELAHWTGAEKRLNRKGGKKFGDNGYATEELIAEITAAFLCAEFDITTLDKGDHAAYISHWLKVLNDNKQCVITAASEATKAVDYLVGLQF